MYIVHSMQTPQKENDQARLEIQLAACSTARQRSDKWYLVKRLTHAR